MSRDKPQVPAFYRIKDFEPIIDRKVVRHVNRECLHFSEQSARPFGEIMHYFSEVSFERAGVLHGEYVLINGIILLRRDGLCIKAGMTLEEKSPSKLTDEYCYSEEFHALKRRVFAGWEGIAVAENPIILSHPYSSNYYHWTLETITRMRFFDALPESPILAQQADLTRLFQRDLLSRTIGSRTALVQKEGEVVRVRDPLLAHEHMSDEAVRWIQDKVRIPTESGNRRIYVRRTRAGTQSEPGGGVSETPEFLAFLAEYGFETIDIGDRELTIEQQVEMFDKAAVLLAPHGAALTNMVYLSGPVTLIEIICGNRGHAFYMHLASMLGFQYYGIYGYFLDENLDSIVNMEELRGVMAQCMAEAA